VFDFRGLLHDLAGRIGQDQHIFEFRAAFPLVRGVFVGNAGKAWDAWDVSSIPRAPKGAGPSGRRAWRAVCGEYELDQHELALVVALVRQIDRLDALEELIAAEGLVVSGHGTCKIHPAVVEARQSAIAVARISAALRLPAGDQGSQDVPAWQRRGGARGVYALRSPA
jgi:hypothetical protein